MEKFREYYSKKDIGEEEKVIRKKEDKNIKLNEDLSKIKNLMKKTL
jgi:hypothetical protein